MNATAVCQKVRLYGSTAALVLMLSVGSTASANPRTIEVNSLIRNTEAYGKPNSCLSHRYEKHQYARSCFEIKEDGPVRIWTKFTNNKRWDGDHFRATYVFKDVDDQVVFWWSQSAGLDAENLGGPGDRYIRHAGRIAPEDVKRIASLTFFYERPDAVPDHDTWNRIITTIQQLVGSEGEGKELKLGS